MVFARMMMEGKVRSAMRWLTSRSGGGLLHPNDEVIDSTTKTAKLVIDLLEEKQPVAKQSKEEARIQVDSLPELKTVTITSSYIENFARSMHGEPDLQEQIRNTGNTHFFDLEDIVRL